MQLLAKFKKILYIGFRATLNFRKFKVAMNFMCRILLSRMGRNVLQSFKIILYMGFRATLNFRKFKVALNLMYRIDLNFAHLVLHLTNRAPVFFEQIFNEAQPS